MNIDKILNEMTLDEKISLLTGSGSMSTYDLERFGLMAKNFADGPHGVRHNESENCTSFPALCCAGASWDTDMMYKMGQALADDCIEHDVDMLLGPGVNIKKNILCGRNFEYISEDPVVSGELGAAYINGLQSKGVGASLKHYAMNNQEVFREYTSVEVSARVMREIYLKAFEIAVKKSQPQSVMCAYNRVGCVYCSENKPLLTDILKDEWGFEGFVVSDWAATQESCKSISAGLDLIMPYRREIYDEINSGLENGSITIDEINKAVRNMLSFVVKPKPAPVKYDRDRQHKLAREIASSGIVMLKNENNTLPITKSKYKKISVIGEYADKPLISGQGSAEVNCSKDYITSPLAELKKQLGDDIEVQYQSVYEKLSYSATMLWPQLGKFGKFIQDSDAVVFFIGSMESEDTEKFDRRTANFNPNYEMFIDHAIALGKTVIVVIQSGSAMILGNWKNKADAILEMWLGGEAAGGAIVDVLTGKTNPSGKLTETFPTCLRTDLDYPGDGVNTVYSEGLDVGYRYYDKHPEEICYPFGYGLSYTTFEYSNSSIKQDGNKIILSFTLANTGDCDGAEVVQIYSSKNQSFVTRSLKELKAFRKVFLKKGEKKVVDIELDLCELAYYNELLASWIVEPGKYDLHIAASSRDIKLTESISVPENKAPYTVTSHGKSMIG